MARGTEVPCSTKLRPFGVIRQTMVRLEGEWSRALGLDVYAGLALALERLEQVLDEDVAPGPPRQTRGRPKGLVR